MEVKLPQRPTPFLNTFFDAFTYAGPYPVPLTTGVGPWVTDSPAVSDPLSITASGKVTTEIANDGGSRAPVAGFVGNAPYRLTLTYHYPDGGATHDSTNFIQLTNGVDPADTIFVCNWTSAGAVVEYGWGDAGDHFQAGVSGTAHTAVLVYDGTNAELFIDGVSLGTQPWTPTVFTGLSIALVSSNQNADHGFLWNSLTIA